MIKAVSTLLGCCFVAAGFPIATSGLNPVNAAGIANSYAASTNAVQLRDSTGVLLSQFPGAGRLRDAAKRKALEEGVTRTIAESLKLDSEEVNPETTFQELMEKVGLTEMSQLYEMLNSSLGMFGFDFNEEILQGFDRVEDIVDFIDEQTK